MKYYPTPTFTPTSTATATPTPTPTPTPICIRNYIGNPDFETGDANPWILSGRTKIADQDPNPYTGGRYSAWLGGYNDGCDDLHQDVSVPTDLISATLTFWYDMYTKDNVPDSDHFNVYIRNATPPEACPTETSILVRIAEMDNSDATEGYVRYVYSFTENNLDAIRRAGGNIQVYFEVTTDREDFTNVFVDEVTLEVCR